MQTGCDAATPPFALFKGGQIIVDHERHFAPSERCFFFNEKRSRKESEEVQNKASNMQ